MSALDIQIGGEHYKNAKIQPIQYIEANDLGFLEGCVVKRITRHDKPTGKGRQDIEKAIHELQLLLEFRYSECPECGYPTDAAGTHYATCSQLTAPEEYKAEAQVAFDEAAELSDALARQVSGGTSGYHCGHCGNAEGTPHHTDCWQVRKGKSRFSQEATKFHGVTADVIAVDEYSAYAEPAAAMDDDSPRMQAIGQNGNGGEHYDDPFAGAPEWAKYKAQDADGRWFFYEAPISIGAEQWCEQVGHDGRLTGAPAGEPNPNWRDTLITRT